MYSSWYLQRKGGDKGKLTGDKKNREWKTRKDPFTKVWDDLIVPKLEAHPSLLAITILENLNTKPDWISLLKKNPIPQIIKHLQFCK